MKIDFKNVINSEIIMKYSPAIGGESRNFKSRIFVLKFKATNN